MIILTVYKYSLFLLGTTKVSLGPFLLFVVSDLYTYLNLLMTNVFYYCYHY